MNNPIVLHCTEAELFSLDTQVLRDATESPNAVAPQEWPALHEGVTTDEDPRHQGEDYSEYRSDGPLADAFRARWGCD